ncbi:MAG: hypothetical protein IPO66_18615 [Rhodanobacteraceae bacterium]|nr:hypothetical protein [Rhodanobacteraceae bacterium]
MDDGIFSVTSPGFDIQIYGTTVTAGSTLRVTTNGTIQRDRCGRKSPVRQRSPAQRGHWKLRWRSVPRECARVVPRWDDLTLSPTGGGIYINNVGSAPNRQFIVEWRGRTIGDGGSTVNLNFAAVFSEGSNSFEYRYVTAGAGAAANGVGATVGLQAATTGTDSLNTHSTRP